MRHPEIEAELRRLDRLARTLDSKFRIPGLGIRFGLDTVVGLVPGVGDTLVALPSAYLIHRAYRLGAPKRLLARMAANTGIDYVVGSIPLVGDIFDVAFKANNRNVAILREHLESSAPMLDVTEAGRDDQISSPGGSVSKARSRR